MLALTLGGVERPPQRILAVGAHSDDIEIGCGGTLLRLLDELPSLEVYWMVLSARGARAEEARNSAEAMLGGISTRHIVLESFRDGFLPYEGAWFLATLIDIFDRAKHTIKAPFSFATDISENARFMTIDGSFEMIERGYHREAMFWIAVTHSRCQKVILCDAPAGMTQTFGDSYRELVSDLRVSSAKEVRRRCADVELILPGVWQLAEAIVATNHEIESDRAEPASNPDGAPQNE